MFYFMMFIILLITYIIVKNRKSSQSLTFAMLLGVYFLAFFAMILYLSKDTYYYNVITQYFYLPKFMWRQLFFLDIPRFTVVRFLNWSSLGIVVASVFFSLTMLNHSHPRFTKICKILIIIYAVIMAVLYDPNINIQSYYLLYPSVLTVSQYNTLTAAIHSCTQFINMGIIILTVFVTVFSCFHLPHIRVIQMHKVTLSICYSALCVCYCFLFSFAPAYFLRISKIAKTQSFTSIRLFDNPVIYSVLPYCLIVFTLLIAYSLFKLSRINRMLDERDLYISKQISASETTSKVFCHYIKNEILAIQSQIEMLPESEENKLLLQNSVERCQNLYQRVDGIHRSTKNSQLNLHGEDLCLIVPSLLECFKGELENVNVSVKLPNLPVIALIDSEYFGQAVHNLIRNSLDSMEGLPADRKNLTLHLQALDRWIVFSVKDTGVGISPENQVNIFTPFFSSSSFSKHWGIGLSLTYKIINAHEGKIEVESAVDKGTTMRIVLPNLKTSGTTNKFTEANKCKTKK